MNLSFPFVRSLAALALLSGAVNVSGTLIVQTLDTSNVTEDSNNNANYAVEIDGDDIRAYDKVNGGGAARTTIESITDATLTGDILNYQVNFVHTLTNTDGTGNMFFLEIGSPTQVFARMSINRSIGTDRFGRSSGSNTGISNPQALTGGTEYGVSVFLNNTGGSLDYSDPFGGTQTLADDTYDIWFGTSSGSLSLITDGQSQEQDTANLNQVTYRMRSVNAIQFETVWSPIPEPSSFALLVAGLVGLAGFRRRRG
jgi:hypothetical protein